MKKERVLDIILQGLELNDLSKEKIIDLEDYNDGLGEYIAEYLDYKDIIQPKGFELKVIEVTGGEGQGDEYYIILEILDTKTNEKVYIRFNAYYDSWNGVDFSSWGFVEPKEVMKTEWWTIPDNKS